MISMRQWLRTSRFLLFILLGMSLFWESCDNAVKQLPTDASSADTLPNKLKSTAANDLFNNFLEYQENVDKDFFFDADTISEKKVLSFQLNKDQAAAFFEELNDLKNKQASRIDSIRIRVRMAFHGKEGEKWSERSNFIPVLELVVNKEGSTGNFYPLRSHSLVHQRIISSPEADSLMQNWEKVPVKDITKQLYLDKQPEKPENRIRYFTFGAKDTEDIYQHQKMLAGKKKPCLFFIHLGQLEAQGDVGLRTIIHLTSRSITTSQDDGDEDFEFSAPCPHFCN